MTPFGKLLTTTCVAAGALASAFTIATGSASADEPKKFKIFLSLSYSGNAWQSEAANIVKALAQTSPYDQMVELKEVISGTDPQGHIAAYESMIDAKADGVISFPISSTALNRQSSAAARRVSCSSCTTRP
jgi:ribose transport system substrate-binding protein